MRPELGIHASLDEEIEHAAERGLPFRAWPEPLRQMWYSHKMARRRRELAFLNAIGLIWCIGCLLLDYAAGPQVFEAALPLRLGLVAPLYLLAIAAAFYGSWQAQRWSTLLAIPAFVGVAGYLGMHVAIREMQEYVMASGLLLAMAVVVLPLRLPWLALMAALSIAVLWGVWASTPELGQEAAVLVGFISASGAMSLLLPLRTAHLKDRNFLYALRAQVASRRLMEANERLRALSDMDELTGLPNRRHLERVFKAVFETSLADDVELAVVMIDVDHFKRFNDTYGHIAGDRTLVQVARLLEKDLSGEGRTVARFGGEEFIAVLENMDEHAALTLADKVRSAIAKRSITGGDRRRAVTVSMGVALRNRADRSPTAIIERADAALYEAKQAGRNLVRLAGGRKGEVPPPTLESRA